MAREFVLEIEKYLDHLVNNACNLDNNWMIGDYTIIPPFNEAVGIPIVESHHRKIPENLGPANYKEEYFILDFEDFFEYATSSLATSFQIDSVPLNHCYYYQALPGSFEKPLFENQYGKFSVMGACLSRLENNLWIITQFKAETAESLKKASRMVDLVGGTNNFLNYFVTLHLVDYRREAFASDKAFARFSSVFPSGRIPEWTEIAAEPPMDDSLVQFTRNVLAPPFETDYKEYFSEWGIKYTGKMWTELHGLLEEIEPKDVPRDEVEAYQTFVDAVQLLTEWEEEFNTEMADNFELARLMRFLPSYFDFMYDLVVKEKKEVGHASVRVARGKKKKTKIVEKPIYKIVKSLRISYLAEKEARQKLNIPQRKWTAPSYRFTVRGHWRQLPQTSWVGHD